MHNIIIADSDADNNAESDGDYTDADDNYADADMIIMLMLI